MFYLFIVLCFWCVELGTDNKVSQFTLLISNFCQLYSFIMQTTISLKSYTGAQSTEVFVCLSLYVMNKNIYPGDMSLKFKVEGKKGEK